MRTGTIRAVSPVVGPRDLHAGVHRLFAAAAILRGAEPDRVGGAARDRWARVAVIALCAAVVAGGCRGGSSRSVTDDTAPSVAQARAAASDDRSGGPIAYATDDGTFIVVGGSIRKLSALEPYGPANAWSGPTLGFIGGSGLREDDRKLVVADTRSSGDVRTVPCPGCAGVASVGQEFWSIQRDGSLVRVDAASLEPATTPTSLPRPASAETLNPTRVVGATRDELVVEVIAPGDPGAEIARVSRTGQVTTVARFAEDDVLLTGFQMAADRRSLLFEQGAAGDCYHLQALIILDVESGERRRVPPPADREVRVEAFWSGSTIYAVFSDFEYVEAEEGTCPVALTASELYRLDGARWVRADGAAFQFARNGDSTAVTFDDSPKGVKLAVKSPAGTVRVPGRVVRVLSCPPDVVDRGPLPPVATPRAKAPLSERWVAVLDQVLIGEDPQPVLDGIRKSVPSAVAVPPGSYASAYADSVLIVEPGPFIDPDQVVRYCDRMRRELPGGCEARHLTPRKEDQPTSVGPGTTDPSAPPPPPPDASNAFGLYDPKVASAAEGRWVAQLLSLPLQSERASLQRAYDELNALMPGVELFRSDDWASFNNPGFWVVYHPGPFDGPDAALAFCASKGRTRGDQCYTRVLSKNPGDRPKFRIPP